MAVRPKEASKRPKWRLSYAPGSIFTRVCLLQQGKFTITMGTGLHSQVWTNPSGSILYPGVVLHTLLIVNKHMHLCHTPTILLKMSYPNLVGRECHSQNLLEYHILVSYWPPSTAEEGGIASFFFFIGTLGRALAAKMCPTNHSPSKRSKQSGVSARNHCFVCFSEQPEKTLGIINRCKSTSSGNGEWTLSDLG